MTRHNPVDLMSTAVHIIRSITSHSRTDQRGCGIPAPDLYRIAASAADLGYAMPQALNQLADALQRSKPVFDVYYPRGHPAENIATARQALLNAADAFHAAAQHLSHCQAALAPTQVPAPTPSETHKNGVYPHNPAGRGHGIARHRQSLDQRIDVKAAAFPRARRDEARR